MLKSDLIRFYGKVHLILIGKVGVLDFSLYEVKDLLEVWLHFLYKKLAT